MTHQPGVSTVLIVLINMSLALIMVISLQSSILLSLRRSKTTSDSAKSLYVAESQVNDVLTKIFHNNIPDSSFPITIPDDGSGSRIEITVSTDPLIPNKKTYSIVSTRLNASTSLLFNLTSSGETISSLSVPIILDCTDTMADPGYTNAGITYSRMTSAKAALKDLINSFPDTDWPNLKIGLAVFKDITKWAPHSATPGDVVSPTFNNKAKLLEALDYGISDSVLAQIDNSLNTDPTNYTYRFNKFHELNACFPYLFGNTALSSGIIFAQDYLSSETTLDKGLILVTDGLPNTAIPDAAKCGSNYYCPNFFERCYDSTRPAGYNCLTLKSLCNVSNHCTNDVYFGSACTTPIPGYPNPNPYPTPLPTPLAGEKTCWYALGACYDHARHQTGCSLTTADKVFVDVDDSGTPTGYTHVGRRDPSIPAYIYLISVALTAKDRNALSGATELIELTDTSLLSSKIQQSINSIKSHSSSVSITRPSPAP